MNNENNSYQRRYGGYGNEWWKEFQNRIIEPREKSYNCYDFLKDYVKVRDLFADNAPQFNPLSNRSIYIIDVLNKLDIRYHLDIFEHGSLSDINMIHDTNTHKLLNIIVEVNPEVEGPSILFVAHKDVNTFQFENANDNSASVCNLLGLINIIRKQPTLSQRVVILFSACEEFGFKGASRFAGQIKLDNQTKILKHKRIGEISEIINLELTGVGDVIWIDRKDIDKERDIQTRMEFILGQPLINVNIPPSDVISFRQKNIPAVCIGTLPESDLIPRPETWSLCHSPADTIKRLSKDDMINFVQFLYNFTLITETHSETETSIKGDNFIIAPPEKETQETNFAQ